MENIKTQIDHLKTNFDRLVDQFEKNLINESDIVYFEVCPIYGKDIIFIEQF